MTVRELIDQLNKMIEDGRITENTKVVTVDRDGLKPLMVDHAYRDPVFRHSRFCWREEDAEPNWEMVVVL